MHWRGLIKKHGSVEAAQKAEGRMIDRYFHQLRKRLAA
jgi:hypothetical protein